MASDRWPKVIRKVKGKAYQYYAVRFTDPGSGKPKIKYCASQQDANDFFGQISHKIKSGTYHPKAHRVTVRDVATQWRQIHLPRVRPTTRANYVSALDRRILKRWGAVRLIDVKVTAVEKWRDELASTVGPSTVRNCLQVLGMVFKFAERDDLIARNPVALVRKPAVRSRRKDALTPDQVGQLLDWLDTQGAKLDAEAQARNQRGPIWPHRVKAFTALGAYCGLREGEIFGLRWSDLDLKAGFVNVQQQYTHGRFGEVKTEAGKRTVGLDRDVIGMLRTWKLRLGRAGPLDLVLPSTDGTPMSASNFLNREFRKALDGAGLPRVTAHSLRHTFASVLKSAGIAPAVAHEVIGHSNYATTMKLYGSVTEDARRTAAEAVADKLRTNNSKIGEEASVSI